MLPQVGDEPDWEEDPEYYTSLTFLDMLISLCFAAKQFVEAPPKTKLDDILTDLITKLCVLSNLEM